MKALLKQIIVPLITWQAKRALKKYDPVIVAVTGNVGKTSTTDAIAQVIGKSHYVRKSEKSFNSELGIPLTILGLQNAWSDPLRWVLNVWEGFLVLILPNYYPRWLVLEVGADRPGDIRQAASWLCPDIAVLTPVGDIPVHIEFFGSVERVVAEKAELAKAVKPGGTLILNYDDERIRALKNISLAARVYTYGFGEEADVRASHLQILYSEEGAPLGISFRVEHKSSSVPVTLMGTIGFHQAHAVLAACAVSLSMDMNLVSATEAILSHASPPGRLRILPGKNNSILFDDTYNASPAATEAALQALKEVKTKGRKIAVLGDMMELGKFSHEAHEHIGESVAESADIFIAVGIRMEYALASARKAKMKNASLKHFPNSVIAGEYLAKLVKEGDIVLLKGSQSMRMERAAEKILRSPREKDLLIRQDPEWLARP